MSPRRPRAARWVVRALTLAVFLTGAPAARAQERRDTLAADSVAQDSVRPLVAMPDLHARADGGFAAGEWRWEREDLLREPVITVVDLLETIPGVTALRAGGYLQPEVASAFGGGRTRLEVFVDGSPLDPLAASTFDLAHIELVQLERLRVERRLDGLRIHLDHVQAFEPRPYSRVDAAVGQPPSNLFRGLFLAPHVLLGPLSLGIGRIDTDGTGRSEPADVFNGWFQWAWTGAGRGVRFELQRSTLKRFPQSPWPVERARQDINLRARQRLGDRFAAELLLGRSTIEQNLPNATEVDTALHRAVLHAGARATWGTEHARAEAGLRWRDRAGLPRTELSLAGELRLGPLALAGDAARAAFRAGPAATTYDLRLRAGPFLGLAPFLEIAGGARAAPIYPDTLPQPHARADRTALRAGAAFQRGRISAGAAFVNMSADSSMPFGLPFDSGGASLLPDDAAGVEAFGRVQVIPAWLAVEGWITEWQDVDGWTYLPQRTWRAVVEVHAVPLPSGNLELLGRIEARYRGAMLTNVPDGASTPEAPILLVAPRASQIDGQLHIRIMDVRLFLRAEDMLGQFVTHLPGRVVQGPRLIYGMKWDFRN